MAKPPRPVSVTDVFLQEILVEIRALRALAAEILQRPSGTMDEDEVRARLQEIHGIGPGKADEIIVKIREAK